MAAAILLLALPSSAFCNFLDGNEIYEKCASDRRYVQIYSMGIADAFEKEAKPYFCLRDGVKQSQMGDVFCNFLRDNPADRNDDAAGLAGVAFMRAWPCK